MEHRMDKYTRCFGVARAWHHFQGSLARELWGSCVFRNISQSHRRHQQEQGVREELSHRMDDKTRDDAPDMLSIDDIKTSVKAYPQYVSKQLEELDPLRYESLPSLLQQRRDSHGPAFLERDEVLKLVEWKL